MINSSAFLYGKGVFTTVAIRDGAPFLWERHWARLTAHAAIVGIDLSKFSNEVCRESLIAEIAKSAIENGKARITFADEGPSEIWPADGEQKTTMTVVVAERRTGAPERLGISKYPINSRSPLAGVKSCNYLENILALDAAKRCGFDEAVRLNEKGEVTSAVMANLFWSIDGRLFTPSLSTGCLAGTTREVVTESLECVEVLEGMDALRRAEAIYLTSAGIGVSAVREFEGRTLSAGTHPIVSLIDSL